MSTTTPAIPTATVIPLQRPADVICLPFRQHPDRPTGKHADVEPDPTLTENDAWWDAETNAMFMNWRPIAQHGRRCACCRPTPAPATEVAS